MSIFNVRNVIGCVGYVHNLAQSVIEHQCQKLQFQVSYGELPHNPDKALPTPRTLNL